MHLLLAQKGSLNESDEAVDLGQSPAELVFLSAADTELSSLADAARNLSFKLDLRLANLMQLTHPMSVDVYCEKTLALSKVVIVRVLGGESYWQYGLEKLLEVSRKAGVDLVVLPGDDKADPSLARYNSVDGAFAEQCWMYLREGGPENMAALLQFVACRLGKADPPRSPVPLLKAGIWSPVPGFAI